jgi:hypothetical protein
MKKHSIQSLAAGVVAVCALSLVAGIDARGSAAMSAGAAATGSATYTDPGGDVQGTAPDITTVAVADDYAAGTITVTLTASGYAASSAAYTVIRVYLDTDKNPATGSADQGGVEYGLGAGKDASGSGWWIDRWDGSTYVDLPQSAAIGFTRSGDTMTWTFNKSDIGGSTGFNMSAWSAAWDSGDNQIGEDVAPDDGTWSYVLSAPPPPPPTPSPSVVVKPVIGTPIVNPARAIAGKRMTVVFPVTRSDTGAPLTTGKMICDPSVSGKVIRHAESFKGGKARLSFLIPKSAKGKLLKVKVTIKVGGQSVTKIASFRVN